MHPASSIVYIYIYIERERERERERDVSLLWNQISSRSFFSGERKLPNGTAKKQPTCHLVHKPEALLCLLLVTAGSFRSVTMGLKQPWCREAGCSGIETRPGPGYDTECGVIG